MTTTTESTLRTWETALGTMGRSVECGVSPARKPLWQIFDEVVEQFASRTAVTFGDQQLTYRELHAQASLLASRLRNLGVGPDSLVGVFLERSAQAIVALLAVVKAGGAYLPLDPAYPSERIATILDDAKPAVLLTEEHLLDRLPSHCAHTICLDREPAADSSPEYLAFEPGAGEENLAYVIYTSGSTGKPKGVMVTHGNVARLLSATDEWFHFNELDVWTLFHSLAFDFSVWEIWGCLLHGGRLVIVPFTVSRSPEDFHELLAKEQVTVLNQTPSAFYQLMTVDQARSSPELALRLIIFGGEALNFKTLRPWFETHDERRPLLINMYGITETTVHVTYREVTAADAADGARSLIGVPIPDLQLYLLGDDSKPVPAGEVGEICVGGAGVARGYLNRPELNAERFVPDPFAKTPGARMYRSGDLARLLPDGEVEYLGRGDAQVKIQGFRIELGEIEAAIAGHDKIREARVVAHTDEAGTKRLAAYYVTRESEVLPTRELSEHLSKKLPPWMMPSVYLPIAAFPLTPHGKVDYAKLPAPMAGSACGSAEAEGTDLEQEVAGAWRAVLGADHVGLDDNFFDIGGNSLLLVSVHAKLQTMLNKKIPVAELFAHTTVRSLSKMLGGSVQDSGSRTFGARPDTGSGSETAGGICTRPRGEKGGPMSSPENENRLEGIAIIGMAGKFPGAPDLETFWANIAAGKDTITRFSRAELEARNGASLEFGPDYVAAHGVLEGAELFDAGFFGIPPREADTLDPQHRLFLETCRNALEDGGYDPAQFSGQIGVFGGCSLNTYLLANLSTGREFIDELTGNYQVGELQTTLGNDKDFLCSRVAYKLNLRGPCMTVQGACATSLVAICQACQNLLTYQCDMALAGGVSVTFPQHRGHVFQEGSMGSRDGRCRPFDADATGTVFGHGVGVVLLKRLEDALADGDRIDAVIRGFAVNNDGAAKVSYMAPGVDGQSAAIAAAQAMAGISADAITYVEAHGTATPLGDPVEVAALTRAFRQSTQRNGFCALGSTKANIGHLDAAAGVSGLIKTVLAMRHRTIPPVANFRKPNPHIDFASTPFHVSGEASPWQPNGPRMAGVSAFGVGGVNAHVVLEEGPEASPETSLRPAQLLCVSARSEAALDAALGNLGRHLKEHPDSNLADVSYTLQTGRHGFDHRASLACSSIDEAARMLAEPAGPQIHRSASIFARPQPVFLFTGQGAQFPGMGRALYQAEPVYRKQIDECAEILQPVLGLDLRTILFPKDTNDTASVEALTETRLAQPALFITELAMARLWMEWGIQPKAMTGHSLGEFVAAVVADVMSREDGLRLVAARGRLMQQMKRGAMLSVRLGEERLGALLGKRLSIAGLNSPLLSVVSGPMDAVEELEKRLQEEQVECKRLRTSHAFHSAMMDPMLDAFEDEVRRVTFHAPSIPYVSGVTGTWIKAEEVITPRYWRDHCRKPVRFADAARLLLDLPEAVLLEVGPGQPLTILARQQRGNRAVPIVASMPERAADAGDSGTMLEALGRLWTAGVQPEWKHVWSHEHRRRVSLPTYPFERKKHWIEPPAHTTAANVLAQAATAPRETEAQIEGEAKMTLDANGTTPERRLRLQPIVASLFEELSGIATGPESFETSFLELGLDSLFLTQATQAVQRRFGVKVTFRQIVEQYSSIRMLADRLDAILPADAFPAEQARPAAALAVAAPATIATLPSAEAGSSLEQLLKAQMQAMSQLFEQQLAAVRGAAPAAEAPRASAQSAISSSVAAKSVPANEATSVAPSSGLKAHGPFKPVQAGTKDGLTEQQHEYIESLIARYTSRTGKSKEYTQKYRPHLTDPRAVAGFRSLWKEMVYPLVTNRSKGSRIWDLDGNEYIDIVNGFGAIMFGHGPEFVTDAVHKQVDLGVEIGPQSSLAGEVAELICELTGMERAAFCNTGSEAVMAALRVARTVTARDKIVYFTGDYHGTFDEVLLRATPHGAAPIAPGIMAGNGNNTVVLEYGAEASLEFIRTHGNEIAAVLVEPMQSRHPEVQPREFLHELRRITEQAGTALIFDEVVTGFRVALGGAQEYYGIRADLATYGKVIGGGYPIGVVAGKAEYLDTLDGGAWQYGDDSAPEVGMTFFAGTFVRHPLALAAAKAVLHHLKKAGPELQETLSRKVANAARAVEESFRDAGLDVGVHPCGAWFSFSLPAEARFGSLLYYHMRQKGIHILESYPCFFTTAHSDEDFARVVDIFRESIQEMRRGGMLPALRRRRYPRLHRRPCWK